MSSTTIRISAETHTKLKALAEKLDRSLTDVVDKAVEQYRRKQIVDEADAQYRALRADPAAWAEYQAEQACIDPLLVGPNYADVHTVQSTGTLLVTDPTKTRSA